MIGLSKVYAKQLKWPKAEALLKSVMILCAARRFTPDEDITDQQHSSPLDDTHLAIHVRHDTPPPSPHSEPTRTKPGDASPRSSPAASESKHKVELKSTEIPKQEPEDLKDTGKFDYLEEEARRNLVRVYESQGKLYEAEQIYKRMYDDVNHHVKTLDRKAEKFISEGKFVEAQNLLKEAYKIKETALPILETMADLYVKHSKFMDALSCYKTCLEIREKLSDPEHYSIAETLNRIAALYKQQQKLTDAESTLQRALKICEKALNTNENAIKFYKTRSKEEQEQSIL